VTGDGAAGGRRCSGAPPARMGCVRTPTAPIGPLCASCCPPRESMWSHRTVRTRSAPWCCSRRRSTWCGAAYRMQSPLLHHRSATHHHEGRPCDTKAVRRTPWHCYICQTQIGAARVTCCKSGKDRTGMGATLEHVRAALPHGESTSLPARPPACLSSPPLPPSLSVGVAWCAGADAGRVVRA
jgi:hypothetical protein